MSTEQKIEPPDSALELTNLNAGAGLNDQNRKRIWDSTRRAIEALNLEITGDPAKGATAVVLSAREKLGDRHTGRRLIVKVIVDPHNQNALAAFRREVRILASEYVPLDVVPVLKRYQDVDKDQTTPIQPFLVEECIDGKPILDYVGGPRPMSILERIELIENGFLAYERLHSSNILHGDGSPNNIFVEKENKVRLIDFGNGKGLRGIGTRSLSMPGGTPNYAPDTQLTGQERRAVWVDIHAFASVSFHVLTGVPATKTS